MNLNEYHLKEHKDSLFFRKLKTVGDFRHIREDENSLIYILKRILEGLLIFPMIAIGGLTWVLMSFLSQFFMNRFANQPSLRNWYMAERSARFSDTLVQTFVNVARTYSGSNTLKLCKLVSSIEDVDLAKQLVLSHKLEDDLKMKILDTIIGGYLFEEDLTSSAAVFIHTHRFMFSEVINRSSDNFVPYLFHGALDSRLINLKRKTDSPSMHNIVSEIYNAFYRPLLYMSYRSVQRITIEYDYNQSLDTIDGYLYELLAQGVEPSDIVDYIGRERLLNERLETDRDAIGLPEEWVLKIIEMDMEDRAAKYEKSSSWSRF